MRSVTKPWLQPGAWTSWPTNDRFNRMFLKQHFWLNFHQVRSQRSYWENASMAQCGPDLNELSLSARGMEVDQSKKMMINVTFLNEDLGRYLHHAAHVLDIPWRRITQNPNQTDSVCPTSFWHVYIFSRWTFELLMAFLTFKTPDICKCYASNRIESRPLFHPQFLINFQSNIVGIVK